MKFFTLTFVLISISINIGAQDLDTGFFNQTWYLHEIFDSDFNETFYVEGYQPYSSSPEIPQIAPQISITPALNFSGNGICNTFEGTLEQNPVAQDSFRVITTNVSDDSCGVFEDMDEPYTIGPFRIIESDNDLYTILNLRIVDDADGFQTMEFETQSFVTYTYRNTPVLSNNHFDIAFLNIYPNPTKDNVYVNLGASYNSVEFQLFNAVGQKIKIFKKQNIESLKIPMEVANGIYFLKVIVNNDVVDTIKIIKN